MEYASCRHKDASASLHKLQGDSCHVTKHAKSILDKTRKARAVAAVSPIIRTEAAEHGKPKEHGNAFDYIVVMFILNVKLLAKSFNICLSGFILAYYRAILFKIADFSIWIDSLNCWCVLLIVELITLCNWKLTSPFIQ